MKLKLLSAAASAALIAVPTLASANDQGWYLRGNAGMGVHNEYDFDEGVQPVELQGVWSETGSLGVGYDFGNNWRLELDGALLNTNMGRLNNQGNTKSSISTATGMLNALYDFSDFGKWEPYVGAGLGIVQAEGRTTVNTAANPLANFCDPAATGGCNFSDKDTGFGWQLLAGLGYDITPRWTWDTHYRYMNAGDFDFEGTRANPASAADDFAVEDVSAHSVMTGLRFNFGGAPAAPLVTCWDGSSVKMIGDCPAEPAKADVSCWDGSLVFNASECPAEPVRTKACWDGSEIPVTDTCPAQPANVTCWDGSLVTDAAFCAPEPQTRSGESVTSLCANDFRQEVIYYGFNKGQSPETRATINRILDVGQFCTVDNIRVIGHTDTSGAAAYNLTLSQRRAKDAKDELVRQGINPAIITSEGKGETEPFVPTGDGVKEQLNRRTEVLIQLSGAGL